MSMPFAKARRKPLDSPPIVAVAWRVFGLLVAFLLLLAYLVLNAQIGVPFADIAYRYQCRDVAPNRYYCRVFEFRGREVAAGEFVLADGYPAVAVSTPARSAASLWILGGGPTWASLLTGGELVPDGWITYPHLGRKQKWVMGEPGRFDDPRQSGAPN